MGFFSFCKVTTYYVPLFHLSFLLPYHTFKQVYDGNHNNGARSAGFQTLPQWMLIKHKSAPEILRKAKYRVLVFGVLPGETRFESLNFFRQRNLIPHTLGNLSTHRQVGQSSHVTLIKAFTYLLNFVNSASEGLRGQYWIALIGHLKFHVVYYLLPWVPN